MKENKKQNLKFINYFLQMTEPYNMPNFSFLKKKKVNIEYKISKTNLNNYEDIISKNSITINSNSFHNSRNNFPEIMNSFSNTQYSFLTPFQKINQYKEDYKILNDIKNKTISNHKKLELMPLIKTDRNNCSNNSENKNNNFISNITHTSPKEYINKIKLYKTINNGYNTIKNNLYSFNTHKNAIKLKDNSIGNFTLENNEKSHKKKNKLNTIKTNEKNNKNKKNLDLTKKLWESINNDIKEKLKKKNKKLNKKFFKNNYQELIHAIKTDNINPPKNRIKKENIKDKKYIYNDNIKYLLQFINFKKKDKNKVHASLNLNYNSPLRNYSPSFIKNLKKVSNISPLFFSFEKQIKKRNQSTNNMNDCLNKESKTPYY